MERERATKFIHELLDLLVKQKGSDLFITADFPPALKVDGKITPVSKSSLTPQHTIELVRSVMNDKQAAEFESTKECNFAISPPGIGRFRVNAFVQQARVGMVLRTINTNIPKFEELGLPPVLRDVIMSKRGIMLFVGATGSGKSTSMASLLGYRNENSYGHIITIEDPIEFVHEHLNCIITQREVGVDTDGWQIALKNTLRQAPDVILIGEIRERETMDYAIAFAETGHLCLATLHANSTNQALDRIINFFPEERRSQLLMDLSLNVRAFVAQRLIPRRDGKGRVPAVEVMLNSPLISDLIFKGDVGGIKDIMKRSRELGMQTFDQSLFDLYEGGLISYEDALRNADSLNDLRLTIKLEGKEAKNRNVFSGLGNLDIVPDASTPASGHRHPLVGGSAIGAAGRGRRAPWRDRAPARSGGIYLHAEQPRHADRHVLLLQVERARLDRAVGHRHARAQPHVLGPRLDDVALDEAPVDGRGPGRRASWSRRCAGASGPTLRIAARNASRFASSISYSTWISTGPSSGSGSATSAKSGSCAPIVTSSSLPIRTRTSRTIRISTNSAIAESAIATRVSVHSAIAPHAGLPNARHACTATRFIATARARTQPGTELCVPADRLACTVTQAAPAPNVPAAAKTVDVVDAISRHDIAHSIVPA